MSQHEWKLGESCQLYFKWIKAGHSKNGLRMKFLTVYCTTITDWMTYTSVTDQSKQNKKEARDVTSCEVSAYHLIICPSI